MPESTSSPDSSRRTCSRSSSQAADGSSPQINYGGRSCRLPPAQDGLGLQVCAPLAGARVKPERSSIYSNRRKKPNADPWAHTERRGEERRGGKGEERGKTRQLEKRGEERGKRIQDKTRGEEGGGVGGALNAGAARTSIPQKDSGTLGLMSWIDVTAAHPSAVHAT